MRQELTHDLEATTPLADQPRRTADLLDATIPCSISLNFGQAVFSPPSLTVASGDLVQFTVTNVAGTLSVPADIFGPRAPTQLTLSAPTVRIPVLPGLPHGVYGNCIFTPTNPQGITGTITIGTGPGDGEGE